MQISWIQSSTVYFGMRVEQPMAVPEPETVQPRAPEAPQPAPVEDPSDEPARSPLEAAGEAGRRVEAERSERRAAPGAVGFAMKLASQVHDETKALTRGNSGLDKETRHEIRAATRELRKDLRALASDATDADGRFDLEAFALGAAEAVEGFAADFAAALGIELPADESDEEPEADAGAPVVNDESAPEAPTRSPLEDVAPVEDPALSTPQ